MDTAPDRNLFREVHRKVQDLRDKARKDRDEAALSSHNVADNEPQKEDVDRSASVPPSDESQ
jgi:hypothetical protein